MRIDLVSAMYFCRLIARFEERLWSKANETHASVHTQCSTELHSSFFESFTWRCLISSHIFDISKPHALIYKAFQNMRYHSLFCGVMFKVTPCGIKKYYSLDKGFDFRFSCRYDVLVCVQSSVLLLFNIIQTVHFLLSTSELFKNKIYAQMCLWRVSHAIRPMCQAIFGERKLLYYRVVCHWLCKHIQC